MSQLDMNADRDPGDEDDGAVSVAYALLLDGVDSQGDLIDWKAFDEAAQARAAESGDRQRSASATAVFRASPGETVSVRTPADRSPR